MEQIIQHLAIYSEGAVLGFAVGILTGLFGAGGGFIITPALNVFLGLPMNLAVGTSACQVLAASSFTFFHNFNKKLPGLRLALCIASGIPVGVMLGSHVLSKLKVMPHLTVFGKNLDAVDFILLLIFTFMLFFIFLWMIIDTCWLRKNHTEEDELKHKGLLSSVKLRPMVKCETIPFGQVSMPLLIGIGFFMGFMSGLLGIGGGVIMMPMLYYVIGQQAKYAVRTSVMLILVSAAFATVIHIWGGNVDYYMVAFLIPGAFIGSRIGSAIHKKISGKSLRKYFSLVVLAAAVMVLVKVILMLLHSPDA